MLIGIIGAPNKGKSTIFSAMTMNEVGISNYPFTTIRPNLGVAYATTKCVDTELGVKCNPRNSLCVDGTRLIPVNIVDVAGLVPGAHIGKGMGNQFLSDLSAAEALIQVVDASGRTDINGNPCEACDPALEVGMVLGELKAWLADIIERHMHTLSRRNDGIEALAEVLSGFRTSSADVGSAIGSAGLSYHGISWDHESSERFAASFLKINKPLIVAANKLDSTADSSLERLREGLKGYRVIGCSGAIELALRKASMSGIIRYLPGGNDFSTLKSPNADQAEALRYMKGYIGEKNGTGIQQLINTAVLGLRDNIVVYPVENENRYSDHFGNVLPDALLVKRGSTAQDMARIIHTELADKMLYAIDARKGHRLSKDYILQEGDVIKIVSAAR